MQYYKRIVNGIVTTIGTINTDGNGNITQLQYEELLTMIRQTPKGKAIYDNGDNTYSYIDAPPVPEAEPTEEDYVEVGRILIGEAN